MEISVCFLFEIKNKPNITIFFFIPTPHHVSFLRVNQSKWNICLRTRCREEPLLHPPKKQREEVSVSPTDAKGPVVRLGRFSVLVIDTKGCFMHHTKTKGTWQNLRKNLWLSFLLKLLFIIWILSILQSHEAVVTVAYRSEAVPLNCFPPTPSSLCTEVY